jgi:hypothetical protein
MLRKLLTLLAQILILAVLVLALADPRQSKQAPQRVVVIIDTSYTMQTRERSGQRMDLAKDKALAALDDVASDGEVVVIQAAHCPLLVQPLTRDVQAARAKIRDLNALDVPGDLEGAVRLAQAFVHPGVRCDLRVVSDFAAANPDTLRDVWNSSDTLRMTPVGEDQPNAAITWLWNETVHGKTLIQAAVSGYRMAGRTVPIVLRVNGHEVDRQEVAMKDSEQRVLFTRTMAENDVFEVALESGDALAIDDKAWGVAGVGQTLKVCLVTEGNVPLERALRAGEGLNLRIVSASQFSGAQDNEVVIVDGALPALDQPGKAAGYLFVGTADPFGCLHVGQWRDCGRITHWSSGHPCMLDVDPTVFRIPKALGVSPVAPFATAELVGASSIPLVLEVKGLHTVAADSRPVRCLYWLFDVQGADLSSHLGFPVMLWNALDYLSCGNAAADRNPRTTGQPIELPRQKTGLPKAVNPLGELLDVKAVGDKAVVVDTVRAGIYRFPGCHPEAYAVNLLSTQSLHRIAEGVAPDGPPVTPSGRWRICLGMNWECLILICVLVGLVEWFLFHRRVLRL